MPVKAYSYMRFSSAAQREGDSLRRQLQAAKDWAAARPDVELDTTTRDLGVSAYKGEHRVRGALASFLKRIEQGDIPKGSYFLIESFDRLSRETEMVAVNLLTSITLSGIRVVTLADGHEYHAGSDAMDIMRAVIVMSRAHNENKARAAKLRAAWSDKKRRARETGEVLSRRGPAWTKFDERSKKFVLIAAYFAFENAKMRADKSVRIFAFDRIGWHKTLQQKQLTMTRPHISFMDIIPRGNNRAGPQKSMFTVTNVDDIEAHIRATEANVQQQFLWVIDIPTVDRDKALADLDDFNVNRSMLFPDLDGFCRSMRIKQFGAD